MKMFSKHLVVYKYLLNNYSMPASFQPQGTEQDGPAPTLLEKDSSHINKHIHSVSPGVVLTVKNKGGGGGEVHLPQGRAPCPAKGVWSVHSLQLSASAGSASPQTAASRGPGFPGAASIRELSDLAWRSRTIWAP